MKIGVLIPTRGDRLLFLELAKKYLLRQTRKPDEIFIHDEPPASSEPDITFRYRTGCAELFRRGCDLVIFWEDDDWYATDYIERLVAAWEKSGKPRLFGIGKTLYYHLNSRKYLEIKTTGRASMCCMAASPEIMKLRWPDDNDPYTDYKLAQQCTVITTDPTPGRWLHVGIKHGIGLSGGAGHAPDWAKYSAADPTGAMLAGIVGLDIHRYEQIKEASWYKFDRAGHPSPLLSIVTRCYKRPAGLNQNMKSVIAQTDKQLEQVYIFDHVGYGLHAANGSFRFVAPIIRGEWVLLLDDDDFITSPELVTRIRSLQFGAAAGADVIVIKAIIKTGSWDNKYPAPPCWEKREPLIAQIGGSCVIVKADVWKKFIHHFNQPRCGDFHFIRAMYDAGVPFYWHDEFFIETGRVGKGRPE